AQQRGQRLGEFCCTTAPCLAVDGIKRRLSDACRDGSASRQAGAPYRTVGSVVIARVTPAAAQRRQRQARADRPVEYDTDGTAFGASRVRALHRTRLCDFDVRLVRIERHVTGNRGDRGIWLLVGPYHVVDGRTALGDDV